MLIPLYNRVILEREQLKTKGIIIPDIAQVRNAPCKGKVIAKGPDVNGEIEVGKTYVFGQYAGAWINAEGTPIEKGDEETARYYVCEDEDLIAEVQDD